jgi:hypothetical protein
MAWLGNALLITSMYRLGGKHHDGWAWSIAGNVCWTWYGVSNGLWAVVFIDGVMLIIAFWNWRKWVNG